MSPAEHDAPDDGNCPLCGQTNECAIVAGYSPESCWCMKAPVSREALARLPADRVGRSCICPHCARPAPTPPSD